MNPRDLAIVANGFEGVTDKVPHPLSGTLAELLELQVVEAKEDANLFSFAEFSEPKQDDHCVLRVHHLVFDVDRPGLTLPAVCAPLAGVAHAVYSTWRHTTDSPRYRVVVVCDRPIEASEYRSRFRAALARLVPLADASQSNPSRGFYAPSCPASRVSEHVLLWGEGEPLRVDSLATEPGQQSPFAAVAAARPPIQPSPREGSRNTELFRYAASLRRRAFAEGEIYALVSARNAALPEPLPADEVAQIAAHAARYEPDAAQVAVERELADDVEPLERGDQVEVARLELERLSAESEVLSDAGVVYCYQPGEGIWRSIDRAELRRRAHAYSGRVVQKPGLTAAGNPHAPALLHVSHSFAEGVARVMIDEVDRPGFFDAAPPGVSFLDCHVSVGPAGVTCAPHAPGNRARHRHPWRFQHDPQTPLWDRFCSDLELAEPVRGFLEEYLGACLVGDVTRHKVCVVLLGEGNNGKSVLLDVVQACFPPGSVAACSPREWGRRFTLSSLVGAALNVVDEMPAGRIVDADVFKEVVSGGRVRGERKYEGAFEFRPRAGHLFAANELPRALDRTEGFFTRWAVVELRRQFAPAERDHYLREKLAAEVPGIASRLVRAAARLVERGALVLPEPVAAAREAWRVEGDHALRFARGLEPDLSARTDTEQIYRAFVRWAENDERLPDDEIVSKKSFGRAMRRAGHEPVAYAGGPRAWHVKFSPFGGTQ